MTPERLVPSPCALLLGRGRSSRAQQQFDRIADPAAGADAAAAACPTWTHATLPNGAELIVSEKHDLPLVSFSITFDRGRRPVRRDEQGWARRR